MVDAIVVGAGLFGQVITAHLRSLGLEVEMVDNREPRSGSRPSASLMKPSWFPKSMSRQDVDNALGVLDQHFGVEELSFRLDPSPLKMAGVKWCDPWKILEGASTNLEINRVGPGFVESRGFRRDTRFVIVAAGVWTGKLLPVPGLEAMMGASCLFPRRRLEHPFIRPWAPYKQLVGFNMHGHVWVGDGSAIKEKNWTVERQQQTVSRCISAVGLKGARLEISVGARPYVPKQHLEGNPCYLKEVRPGVWAATGGAKNGTLAAGWAAHTLGKVLA